jgi:hypothetical protein
MGKTITILSHKYSIILDPTMTRDAQNGGGKCSSNNLVITIDPTLPISNQREILLHEIIEAINYRIQLHLDHDKLSALSEMLAHVLLDNRLASHIGIDNILAGGE